MRCARGSAEAAGPAPEARRHSRRGRAAARLAAALGCLIGAGGPAAAATYTVTTLKDDTTTDSQCTLREALSSVNGGNAADCPSAPFPLLETVIRFEIADGVGAVKTIALGSPLLVVQPVRIDGYTQAGASANSLASGSDAELRVDLDGSAVSMGVPCLLIDPPPGASPTTIRGLAIRRCNGPAIEIHGENVVIAGNFIGTNVAGTAAGPGNAGPGVRLACGAPMEGVSDNRIGGPAPADRNVISANGGQGVVLTPGCAMAGNVISGNLIGVNAAGTGSLGNGGPGVEVMEATDTRVGGLTGTTPGGTCTGECNVISGNTKGIHVHPGPGTLIQGNHIGTDASGSLAIGNQQEGVRVEDSTATIGSLLPAGGNVVSANGQRGIVLQDSVASLIRSNRIGTRTDGQAPLGNQGAGIAVQGGSDTSIGAATTGGPGGNTIAFNGQAGSQPGVLLLPVLAGAGHTILGNAIFSNAGAGIELAGANPADACDLDGGPNQGQNAPALASVLSAGGRTFVTGSLASAPGASYTVELFANPAADPTEGRTFLGSTVVTTGLAPACAGPIEVVLPAAVPPGDAVTATATSPSGDTSPFSAPAPAVFPPLVTAGPSGTPNPAISLEVVQLGVGVTGLVTAPTFAWTAECPGGLAGSFDDAASRTPRWVAARLATHAGSAGTCLISVTVGDGAGGSQTASYTQTVERRVGNARIGEPLPGPAAFRPAAAPDPAPGQPGGRAGEGGALPATAHVAPLPASGDRGVRLVRGAAGGPAEITITGDGRPELAFIAFDGEADGVRVAACDLDGDGVPELITGAGPGGPPLVRVWGLEGAVARLRAEAALDDEGANGGVFVACGDLDGTGGAVVLTAAGSAPRLGVLALTGAGLAPRAEAGLAPGDYPGGARVAAGDLDGDGRAEVLVAPGPGGAAHVLVLDGQALAGGRLVERARADVGEGAGGPGFFVAAGDLDGDGRAEVAVGLPHAGGLAVRVLDGRTLADLGAAIRYEPDRMAGVALPTGP